MTNIHIRPARFRKSVFIFTIGVICGVLIFHTFLKRYGCLMDLTEFDIQMTPTIFVGIIRHKHDMNDTLPKVMQILQNDKVDATTLVCQEDVDAERSSGFSGCIHHLYQHQNVYEWFVLTPGVVSVDLLPSLLMSLPHQVPVSLVHPECPSMFDLPDQLHVLILNQAALTLILRRRMGIASTAMCDAMIHETVNLSLEKVAAMYGRSRGVSTNFFDKLFHTKDNTYAVAIRHLEAKLRQLQFRTAFLTQTISFIDVTDSAGQPSQPMTPRHIQGGDQLKEWDFINASRVHSLSNSNAQPTESVYNRGRELILTKSLDVGMNVFSGTQPACTYQRVVVGRAVEHIMIHNQNQNALPRNYKTVQRFDTSRFREIKPQRDSDLVIVLPLFKRSADFIRFIRRLRSVALDFKGSLMLNVVLFRDKKGEYIQTLDAAIPSTGRLVVKVIPGKGKFTRAGGIAQGIGELEEDARVLIIDVDVMFTIGFLNRVVRNTRPSKPFFPIYFSRYDPRSIQTRDGVSTKRFVFDERFGRWRYFSYGVVGIYVSDLLHAGNFDISLHGWGMEDIEFYHQCLMSNLQVFRTVDLGLWHIYHTRHCDPHLRQERLEMCHSSRQELEMSHSSLAAIVLNLTRSDLMR
ncbi:uncharacterized protein [Haliotis asinina]|uniref:uncharacterized protein n=1 Tax=Haliotis asinina TaxID=109174 RepID=UPI0035320F0B